VIIAGEGNRVVVDFGTGPTVLSDPSRFYDLDEAMAVFPVQNPSPMLPTYLPEGFSFGEASYTVCPVRNPNEPAGRVNIKYSNGKDAFALIIGWGVSYNFSHAVDDNSYDVKWFTAFGHDAVIHRVHRTFRIDMRDIANHATGMFFRTDLLSYNFQFIDSDIDNDELMKILESMR